jgi:hypothetical protein
MAGVTAADVIAFVLVVCPGRATGLAKVIVYGLRSLLGWLHLTGTVPVSLATAVPSVAGWRPSSLPKGLEPGQLRRRRWTGRGYPPAKGHRHIGGAGGTRTHDPGIMSPLL